LHRLSIASVVCTLLVCLLCASAPVVDAALSGSDLLGEYGAECVPTVVAGEQPWYRNSQLWMSAEQMREYAQVWDTASCDASEGEVLYEFDFSSYYTVGELLDDTMNQYALERTFRSGLKKVVARSTQGQLYLQEICADTAFPLDQWVDVLSLTCAPLFYACGEGNVEYGCVAQEEDRTVRLCQPTSSQSACDPDLASTRQLDASVAYSYVGELRAPADGKLDGGYGYDCVPLSGLPPHWRVSEDSEIRGDQWCGTHDVYTDASCTGIPSLSYYRCQTFVNGAFYEAFVDQLLPTFEQDTSFVGPRTVRASDDEGKALMDQICGIDFPLDEDVEVGELDCPPFLFTCDQVYSCFYRSPVDGSLLLCGIDPATGSCAPQNRVAQYGVPEFAPFDSVGILTVDRGLLLLVVFLLSCYLL